MEFSISSTTLNKHLTALYGAIASNPLIPILENFLFEMQNNRLKITASDLQTFISTELPLEVENFTAVAIPARILLDTIKNLPEQPVKFHVDQHTYTISITSVTGRYTLAGENATDFPTIPNKELKATIKLPSEVLKRAIQQTINTANNDTSQPATNGIYMKFQAGSFTFVATDRFRLVRYNRYKMHVSEHISFILPRKSLLLLNGLLPSNDQLVEMSFEQSNVHFQWGDIKVVARLIDEKYPDYENVIPENGTNQLTINRMNLLGCLRRMMVYTNKTTHQVKLTLTESVLAVLAEDLQFDNKAKEELACEYTGEGEFEIAFSAKFLMELLQGLQAEVVTFYFSMPHQAALITPTPQLPEEDILLLIMPIKLI